MPTDPTTAEKAERLGLKRCDRGMDCPFCSGRGYLTREGFVQAADDAALHALYAERFPQFTVGTGIHPNAPSLAPAPDYRAALEALEAAGTAFDAGLSDLCDGAERDALRAALTHARKVLHGQ